ncbi:MAG: ABC transporter substrate-binding protein, partial [Acidobacteriota bacterium]
MLARPARSAVLPALVLAALSLTMTGCRGNEDKSGEAAPTPAAEMKPQRGGTVVIAWSAAPTGVNELIVPNTAITTETVRQLFLHLVSELPDFEEHPPTMAPQLAESFEFSPDHKILTFHLRKDVVWSDGVPVTADDVRFTWQAHTHPDVAWNSAYMKEKIKDVEVVDPHTARFHFSEAYAKQILDVNEGVILPKHAWGQIPFPKWRESSEWFLEHLVV